MNNVMTSFVSNELTHEVVHEPHSNYNTTHKVVHELMNNNLLT